MLVVGMGIVPSAKADSGYDIRFPGTYVSGYLYYSRCAAGK